MLNERIVTDVLLAALSTGGDFAEIFMEDTYNTALLMLDGKVEQGVTGRDYGVVSAFIRVCAVFMPIPTMRPGKIL